MVSEISQYCDLCIIGAGITGVAALNAATKYLKAGSTVMIIDKNKGWGGHWNWQYDYVRLHQPYVHYTIPSRPWKLENKPNDYLANKREILAYLQDIVQSCTSEKNINLIEMFEFVATVEDNSMTEIVGDHPQEGAVSLFCKSTTDEHLFVNIIAKKSNKCHRIKYTTFRGLQT